MKLTYMLCLLFIVSNHVTGQTQKDSLLTVLPTASDTGKVLIYQELARLYSHGSTDSALYYTNLALAQSEKADYESGKIRSYWILGLLYSNQGDFPKSIEYCKKTLTVLKDSLQISSVLNNLGAAYFDMGAWDEGIKYSLQSLKIKERHNATKRQLASAYQNLGACYQTIGDFNTALTYANDAYNLYGEIDNKLKQGDVMMNIALIYQEQNDIPKAREAFAKTIDIQKEIQNLKGLSNTYCGVGALMHQQKEYDSALFFLEQSLSLANSVQNYHYIIMSTVNVASVWFDKGNYQKSIALARSAITGLDSLPALRLLRDAYEIQARSYDKLAMTSQALDSYKHFFSYRDSLLNKEKLQDIHDMKLRYETEKKEIVMAQLKAEIMTKKAQARTSAFMALLSFLGIIALIYILDLRSKLHKQHLTQLEIEKKQKQYELEMKEQELSGLSMNMLVKTNTLKLIKEKISTGNGSYNAEAIKAIDNNLKFDKEWDVFKLHFEKVHQGFFDRLSKTCPNITPNEQRLCAYLKMNFSTKEVSRIANVSVSAIDKSRQRLRKKLNIDSKENLVSFIQGI
ncbi:tetratricopeptide repeat protein [Fulvivirga sp. 29W222]|uniref:Tetratricopeptide repeat protein n=1 Tax=Fulvivirga marina TaxID=2494733 RepID=A0A937FV96_9BACT|nr:tetratricopeptide repeat protein [Fulvivirga marina]MBL6446684.1 tetratricopeptide repeat protein [Fulvivirga marina]